MIKKDIVIFGAGGFGREVLWLLEENNKIDQEWNILGFVVDSEYITDETINGYCIVGDSNWLINYSKEIFVVCCIGSSNDREKVIERLSVNKNIQFPNLISKDVKVSDTISLGKGCIICASTIVTVNVTINDFVIINLDCTIGHNVALDNYVTLYPSVNVSGNVHILSNTEVGTGTNIIPKVQIGRNSILGAGSVVIRDIPSNCVAVGSPAKTIKFLEISEDHEF